MRESLKETLENFTYGSIPSVEILSSVNEIETIEFPDDYVEFMTEANGGEGFIGAEYLILWKAEELARFNSEYEVEKYAPGVFLFGSNGGGEGFGFDTRCSPYIIVQVPFVGMDLKYAHPVAESFLDLLEKMSKSTGSLLESGGAHGEQFTDREIVEVRPVIVGGSPTDPSNKSALRRDQHFQFVRYWNRIIGSKKGERDP